MNVVLLAAGLGSRLGALTRDLPKALIHVGGKPLLFHALSFAAHTQPTRIIVVGGFAFPLVKEALQMFRAGAGVRAPIELVENTSFRDGNLVSAIQKVLDMKLRDETLARLVALGTVTMKIDFSPVPPGTYSVRLVVRDSEAQSMAAVNGAVAIQ